MSESTALAVHQPQTPSSRAVSVWESIDSFERAQRMAGALVASDMVPESYRGNMGNALIALDLAQRVNMSPLMVMQNLNVIEGKPAWASKAIIAMLNSCGRFTVLQFRVTDKGVRKATYEKWVGPKGQREKQIATIEIHDKECVAFCKDKRTGADIEGPEVSIGMAVAEGWYTKPGSKWVTMQSLMLRYRAASFFGNLYAPDLLMGIPTVDERFDIEDVEYEVVQTAPAPAVEADKPRRARGVAAAMAKSAEAGPKVVVTSGPQTGPATGKPRTAVEAQPDGRGGYQGELVADADEADGEDGFTGDVI